ncbi:MAG: type II secretion system F family protein [Verrucomicrobia bacterium]|nr:type II secretion system F family protein [Verrucomicrobiota bacterium]
MPLFSYKARKRTGEVIEGTLEVADRPALLLQLEKSGLMPVTITNAKGDSVSARRSDKKVGSTERYASLPPALRNYLTRAKPPKLQELATFTQQLANLLRSGMPLVVALNSMTHLSSKGIPSEISRQLKTDVMEGRSMSDAMAKQPVVFSELFVNMVRAGEQSGALVEVLVRLSQHYERFADVQQKFVAALIYPAIVGSVGVGIIIFFMTFMMPKFMSIFEGIKVPLPASTKFLMDLSNFMNHYWWLLLIILATVVMVFKRFQSSAAGRRAIDGWKMNAPVLGPVMKLNLFGQFARTLGTLLRNGVPVLTALKITEQIIPNVKLKEAIAQTREAVTDGKTLAQPLARSKMFPQLMLDLLKIGEDTGDVPGALENIATTYENELTLSLRVATNLIEPAMIICMALGVGFLLFSILSAMFAITGSIGTSMR